MLNPDSIYFHRNDLDTWAMDRLHHSLLLEIQDNPLWEREDVIDIPLDEEQMVMFVKGYQPSWEARYAPYLLGGWYYITRSGHWLKKFKYKKGRDGLYHVTESYTTPKVKGQKLLAQVLIEGHFDGIMRDERLHEILKTIDLFH